MVEEADNQRSTVTQPKRESRKPYKLVSKSAEGKKAVFGGAFNSLDSRFLDLFACVCANKVQVLKCQYGQPTVRLQAYVDENEQECFYTVTWLSGAGGVPLLAASGETGVIRVIDTSTQTVHHSLLGHGGAVNEVRVHPREPSLFISGSKDESLRVWNAATGVCALVLGGARGHRNEVLSADFHPGDKAIVASSGMDSSIRIWSLHRWWSTVELSHTWQGGPSTDSAGDGESGASFPTKIIQYPMIVVPKVHTNYVDCLRWYGDFILTKSVENEVVMWRWCAKSEESGPAEGMVDVLMTLRVPECDIWFLKFSLDAACTIMAVGNREGKTHLWDMSTCPPSQIMQLVSRDCKSSVRQTAVSHCGRTVMSCCDDGTVWRWERASRDNEK